MSETIQTTSNSGRELVIDLSEPMPKPLLNSQVDEWAGYDRGYDAPRTIGDKSVESYEQAVNGRTTRLLGQKAARFSGRQMSSSREL